MVEEEKNESDGSEKVVEMEKKLVVDEVQHMVVHHGGGGGGSCSPTVYPTPLATHEEIVKNAVVFMDALRSFHSSMSTKFMIPVIGGKDLDLHQLYVQVTLRGGLEKVILGRKWREVIAVFNFPSTTTSASFVLRKYYLSLLHHFEQVYFFRAKGPLVPPAGSISLFFLKFLWISIVLCKPSLLLGSLSVLGLYLLRLTWLHLQERGFFLKLREERHKLLLLFLMVVIIPKIDLDPVRHKSVFYKLSVICNACHNIYKYMLIIWLRYQYIQIIYMLPKKMVYFCMWFKSTHSYIICQQFLAGLITGDRFNFSVSGTIDGKFDHGYFVTVKMNSETLRGVLYHAPPSMSSPPADHSNNAIIVYSPGQAHRRQKRYRDPAHPKPNRSAYNFFFAQKHAQLKAEYPRREREFSKMIGESWNKLNDEERLVSILTMQTIV
ncbi:putative transcription factor & chromatin remodeling ARID-HMG family [Dioscorea sansibarensis]